MFGGYKQEKTGKQFVDVSYPLTTTKADAVRRAENQIQDLILGISSTGRVEAKFLPDRGIPKGGSEPLKNFLQPFNK